METRLPGANSWSAKGPIQFDEVIVFSTIWVPCAGMLVLDLYVEFCYWITPWLKEDTCGRLQTSSLGGYICYFVRPAWQLVIMGEAN